MYSTVPCNLYHAFEKWKFRNSILIDFFGNKDGNKLRGENGSDHFAVVLNSVNQYLKFENIFFALVEAYEEMKVSKTPENGFRNLINRIIFLHWTSPCVLYL